MEAKIFYETKNSIDRYFNRLKNIRDGNYWPAETESDCMMDIMWKLKEATPEKNAEINQYADSTVDLTNRLLSEIESVYELLEKNESWIELECHHRRTETNLESVPKELNLSNTITEYIDFTKITPFFLEMLNSHIYGAKVAAEILRDKTK